MIKMNSMVSSAEVTVSERYLHTPSSFAKQNLYYVQEVGKLQSLVPHRCIRENLDSFLVMLVLEGQGSLTINEREYWLKSGDCAFVDCKEHHEHISSEEDAWKLAWVHFNGKTVRSLYELFYRYNHSVNVYHADNSEEILKVIGQLMSMGDNRDLMSELHSSELLLRLVRILIGSVADAELIASDADRALLKDVREFLNNSYTEENVFALFEREFATTMQDFDVMFKSHYGIGIEEYVNNRRFLAAKELLRFSIKSIPEVAKEAGFLNVSVMQEMFDRVENMTVEEYRSKWAQWVQ